VSVARTASTAQLPEIADLGRTDAVDAHQVSFYERPDGDGTTLMVIEVFNLRGDRIARTCLEHLGEDYRPGVDGRRSIADEVLGESHLERYGEFHIDPVHRYRRQVADVGIRVERRPVRPRLSA
jgi:hypothetical protein